MSFPVMPWTGGGAKPQKYYEFVEGRADASNLTTYTFSSVAITKPTSTRTIICFVGARASASRSVVSVTIGGVAATLYRNISNDPPGCIAVAIVPTGSSIDVVVVYSSGCDGSGLVVWQADGLDSPIPTYDDRDREGGGVSFDVQLVSFQTPSYGFSVFGAYSGRAATPPWSWTNATEEYDAGVGGGDGRVSGASRNRLTGTVGVIETVTATSTDTNGAKLLIGAAFK